MNFNTLDQDHHLPSYIHKQYGMKVLVDFKNESLLELINLMMDPMYQNSAFVEVLNSVLYLGNQINQPVRHLTKKYEELQRILTNKSNQDRLVKSQWKQLHPFFQYYYGSNNVISEIMSSLSTCNINHHISIIISIGKSLLSTKFNCEVNYIPNNNDGISNTVNSNLSTAALRQLTRALLLSPHNSSTVTDPSRTFITLSISTDSADNLVVLVRLISSLPHFADYFSVKSHLRIKQQVTRQSQKTTATSSSTTRRLLSIRINSPDNIQAASGGGEYFHDASRNTRASSSDNHHRSFTLYVTSKKGLLGHAVAK